LTGLSLLTNPKCRLMIQYVSEEQLMNQLLGLVLTSQSFSLALHLGVMLIPFPSPRKQWSG
jgi:hypothetical protein